MNIKNFWNDAAKWGLLIGIIMGSSRILEFGMMLSGSVSSYSLLTVEWVVVAILFVSLLYYAMRKRAEIMGEDIAKFITRYLLNYAIMISIFASVIVSAMSFVYINSHIGGYDIYMERLTESVIEVMNSAQMEGTVRDTYLSTFEEMRGAEVAIPTIFDTLLSTMAQYIILGAAVGFALTFVVKRKTQKRKSDVADE